MAGLMPLFGFSNPLEMVEGVELLFRDLTDDEVYDKDGVAFGRIDGERETTLTISSLEDIAHSAAQTYNKLCYEAALKREAIHVEMVIVHHGGRFGVFWKVNDIGSNLKAAIVDTFKDYFARQEAGEFDEPFHPADDRTHLGQLAGYEETSEPTN